MVQVAEQGLHSPRREVAVNVSLVFRAAELFPQLGRGEGRGDLSRNWIGTLSARNCVATEWVSIFKAGKLDLAKTVVRTGGTADRARTSPYEPVRARRGP